MKILILPTDAAKLHFPDEPFEAVEVLKKKLPINKEVEVTEEQYHTLVTFSYAHPEHGLSCKYFVVKVISLVENNEPDAITSLLLDQCKLYAGVYLTLESGPLKDKLSPQALVTATSAVYEQINNQFKKEEAYAEDNESD